MNPLVFVPGAATLLFTVFEMPHRIKKTFFKVPVWLSSSVIAMGVGTVGRGVLGPMTGFMTELILFPGLYLAKKHFEWKEKKIEERKCGSTKKNLKKRSNSSEKTSRIASLQVPHGCG